jgi:hypothetical protein
MAQEALALFLRLILAPKEGIFITTVFNRLLIYSLCTILKSAPGLTVVSGLTISTNTYKKSFRFVNKISAETDVRPKGRRLPKMCN